MRNGEELIGADLRITYKFPEINEVLEKDLEELLEQHDYIQYASGFDFVNKVRDLAYDQKKNEPVETGSEG
jgi:hypothetical protein